MVIPALSGFVNTANAVINSVAFSLVFCLCFPFPIASVVLRLRRAQGAQRQQLKWFVYTAVIAIGVATAGGLLGTFDAGVGDTIANLGFGLGIIVAVPAAIGLAVMKYGLYDIDVVISRTLVYGSLAVCITAVYVGIAVGIGALVGSGQAQPCPVDSGHRNRRDRVQAGARAPAEDHQPSRVRKASITL